eukprot:GHVO01038765.1.p1 GENE.GHVO01038765.1~~GHVO01038765.1.p1  ORF type:complete len:455 (+),score=30.36 GHVO01038765.1:32-1396(+)
MSRKRDGIVSEGKGPSKPSRKSKRSKRRRTEDEEKREGRHRGSRSPSERSRSRRRSRSPPRDSPDNRQSTRRSHGSSDESSNSSVHNWWEHQPPYISKLGNKRRRSKHTGEGTSQRFDDTRRGRYEAPMPNAVNWWAPPPAGMHGMRGPPMPMYRPDGQIYHGYDGHAPPGYVPRPMGMEDYRTPHDMMSQWRGKPPMPVHMGQPHPHYVPMPRPGAPGHGGNFQMYGPPAGRPDGRRPPRSDSRRSRSSNSDFRSRSPSGSPNVHVPKPPVGQIRHPSEMPRMPPSAAVGWPHGHWGGEGTEFRPPAGRVFPRGPPPHLMGMQHPSSGRMGVMSEKQMPFGPPHMPVRPPGALKPLPEEKAPIFIQQDGEEAALMAWLEGEVSAASERGSVPDIYPAVCADLAGLSLMSQLESRAQGSKPSTGPVGPPKDPVPAPLDTRSIIEKGKSILLCVA